MSCKSEQRELVIARLETALENVYHNATIDYPSLDDDDLFSADFEGWLQGEVESAFDNIQSYDKWGSNRRSVFCKRWGQQEIPKKYVRRSNLLNPDRLYGINEYGPIYSYGRGGRTVAPEQWTNRHGGSSFSIKKAEDMTDRWTYDSVVQLVLLVEAFNAHVEDFCNRIKDGWKNYVDERTAANEDHTEVHATD